MWLTWRATCGSRRTKWEYNSHFTLWLPYQLDLSSYVSTPPLCSCHLLINLIYHYMCPSHITTLVTSYSTWYVIICVYPTCLPMSPPYQIVLSSYVSIPLSIFVTFLSTWTVLSTSSVIIYEWYPTSSNPCVTSSLSSWSVIIMCLSYLSNLVTLSPYQLDLQ